MAVVFLQYGLSLLLAHCQVAQYQKHNEDLIQEMDKVMSEVEKLKSGKSKKKPSDADDPFKV